MFHVDNFSAKVHSAAVSSNPVCRILCSPGFCGIEDGQDTIVEVGHRVRDQMKATETYLIMANAASLIMTSSLLKDIAYNYPAIDNHAHPICTAEHRSAFPLEGIISEAQGSALTDDSIHTLASYRAMRQLATLYGIVEDSTWEELKAARDTIPYDQLCALAFQPTRIQCLLLDDGLGGVNEFCHNAAWHNNYTPSPTKRIVRVEVVAQVRLVLSTSGTETLS